LGFLAIEPWLRHGRELKFRGNLGIFKSVGYSPDKLMTPEMPAYRARIDIFLLKTLEIFIDQPILPCRKDCKGEMACCFRISQKMNWAAAL